jgi:hypothetical protein
VEAEAAEPTAVAAEAPDLAEAPASADAAVTAWPDPVSDDVSESPFSSDISL